MGKGALAVTEKQFEAQVREWAKMQGWLHYKTWLPIHSPAGFPDLCMVRGERLVFIECKSDKGKTSPKQDEWLAALRGVPGIEVYLWRPADFDTMIERLR